MPQRLTENHLSESIEPLHIKPPKPSIDEDSIPLQPDDAQSKDGIIIIQNNQFYITSPLPGGKPAIVSPIPPVVLKKNRQMITAPTEVLSSDRLEWEIQEKPQYEITVSEDKLKAFFTLHRVEQYAWKLDNCPATHSIAVRAKPDRGILLSTLGIEQIIADFEKKSITHNLNIPAIYAELNHPAHSPICVAEGKAPLPGAEARMELFFDETIENVFSETDNSKDDQDRLSIASVKEGDVIARRIPPVEGVPGVDVYGRVLSAPPPDDIKVVPNHTQLLPNDEITALRDGRPRMTGTHIKYFDIATAYEVPGSANLETGNILYSGDVIVHGDVEDQVIIEALGNVYIYGGVYNSTITATGSIFVRGNVIDSHLYAGNYGVMQNRLYNLSKQLMEEGTLLQQAAKVLTETVASRHQSVKFGQVIQLLLDTKYTKIAGLIHDLQTVLSDIKSTYQQDTDQLKRLLEVFLRPAQFIGFFSNAVVASFLKQLKGLYSGVADMQEAKVRIDIPHARSSTIKSAGNISIHKKGVVQSDLLSSGDITFVASDSVCQSSTLEAEGIITAQTVRGEQSAKSILKAGKKMMIRKIYEGSITVGRYSEEIVEPVQDIVITPQILQERD